MGSRIYPVKAKALWSCKVGDLYFIFMLENMGLCCFWLKDI